MSDFSELLKLSADLGNAPAEVVQKGRLVVAKTAHDVEATAKSLAAVDTGAMRNSIGTTISGGGLTAEIGPTVHYAIYNEYGTRRMTPRPFMGPALERHSEPFVQAVAKITEGLL